MMYIREERERSIVLSAHLLVRYGFRCFAHEFLDRLDVQFAIELLEDVCTLPQTVENILFDE
jgi:hypothetical protein